MFLRSLLRLNPANLETSISPAFLVAASMVVCSATSARAQLHLTPAGIALFRADALTVFASGFPVTNSIGPFGVDYQTDGNILVTTGTGNLQRFANTDGQNAVTIPVLRAFGAGQAIGLAHIGSNIYLAQNGAPARVTQINANGSDNHVVATGISGATGLVASPVSGHLFCTTNIAPFRIFEIDAASGTTTVFQTMGQNIAADGMTFSADYSILYAARNDNHMVGYNVATGAQVFDSGLIANVGAIDGSALGFGALANNLFVNTRNGFVVQVGLNAPFTQTIIASGGTRGDFVTSDPSGSGDMLITQTGEIYRLRGIPSPSVVALLCLGSLVAARRRR
jgi:hypothetical protein